MISFNIFNKVKKTIGRVALLAFFAAPLLTSCQDFFDVDSTYVIDADKEHLNKANDSIYSVIGILNKVQAIADRTVLLGEARADLVDITAFTEKDLRNVALFNIDDENKYNQPRDYYAIINNCNYFLAHVDTAMQNNRGENIFLNEYAVVKAVRAWTYLQLVLNYGEVPFVTEPILTKEDAEKTFPKKDIQAICDYFLNEDGLQALADNENITYPFYGNIKGTPSRLFYFPLNIVLGDLYLWKASFTNQKADYLAAAKRYYAYISKRNGTTTSSAYPTTESCSKWSNTNWLQLSSSWGSLFWDETNGAESEVITVIPMDSVRSEGYYSELRSIFCSDYNDNNEVSLVPSQAMKDLSAAQDYCYYDQETSNAIIAPKGLPHNADGDLRLATCYSSSENSVKADGTRYTSHEISKFLSKNGNINIYRRAEVYLRLAEAMNCAGYPRFAFQILQTGLSDDVILNCVTPVYGQADSLLLSEFSFPRARYHASYWGIDGYGMTWTPNNSIGIHSRGSGDSRHNPRYQMPYVPQLITVENGKSVLLNVLPRVPYVYVERDDQGEVVTRDTLYTVEQLQKIFIDADVAQREWQMGMVEKLILDENALELAFEGKRFYDLMRVSIRHNNPSLLANYVNQRKGAGTSAGISVDLTNKNNWFLKWDGKIGIY